MISVSFPAIILSFPMQYTSVHMLDTSTWFPRPFGSSGAHFVPSPGKSGSSSCFRGVLTMSGMFVVVNVSISMLGSSMCPFDASVCLEHFLCLDKVSLVVSLTLGVF